MTLSEQILYLLENQDAPVDSQWVRELLTEYPAFTFPAALLIKRGASNIDEETLKDVKLRLLINSPDPTALADMADLTGDDWVHLYPAEQAPTAPSTESVIDTFLDTYGRQSEAETATLEQLIFNPVPADYFSEEEAPSHSDGPLLPPELMPQSRTASVSAESNSGNDVTNVTPTPTATPQPVAEKTKVARTDAGKSAIHSSHADESLLSESLAKIFIKQGRYERAYEIIGNLSLNFPEKSVYFADQMRFLQKLIKNQQYQQQNK